MLDKSGSYSHRGAVELRARRMKRQIVGISVCAVLLIVYQSNRPAQAASNPAPDPMEIAKRLELDLARTRGELEVANEQLERWHRIFDYASQYDISVELASSIHDVAFSEGIEPEQAYRLVRLASSLDTRATSHVGAGCLAQGLRPAARCSQEYTTRAS